MKKLLLITKGIILSALPITAQTCFNTGNGADGVYSVSTNTSLVGGTYNFTSFNIDAGATISVTGSQPLVIRCTGAVTINGSLNASGGNGANGVTYVSGGTGGIGVAGGGNGGGGNFSVSLGPLAATNGSGIGGAGTAGGGWSGGGGAGYATGGTASGNGSGGFAGPAYGNANISGLEAGSGGGGGSGGYSCGSGGGGAGGGIIVINAGTSITIGSTGSILVNGGNGGSDGTGNCGGGGGGSGGSIWIAAPLVSHDGILSATGGSGGASNIPGSPYYGTGGNGAAGRIRVDYNGTMSGTGTSNPAIGFTQAVAVLAATTSQTNVNCNGANNGTATVNVTSGTPSYSYSWTPSGGSAATASSLAPGTYTCTITDACVSITEVFTITEPAANGSSQTLSLCAGQSVSVGANTYSVTGNYTDVLTAANGCDSTVITNLTVNAPIASSQTMVLCDGQSVSVGANTYSSTGIYTDVLTAVNGCDSTVTTDLTVDAPIATSQTLSLCAGQSVSVGANTYSVTGIYTDVLTAANGCDSTVTTNLTMDNPIDVSTTLIAVTITSNAVGVSYQWIDCNNGNAPIAGENAASYITTGNGDYAVIVTQGACADTSACVSVTTTALHFQSNKGELNIFPNPNKGSFVIHSAKEGMYIVTDELGRTLQNIQINTAGEFSVSLENLKAGIYFLRGTGKNSGIISKIVVVQ